MSARRASASSFLAVMYHRHRRQSVVLFSQVHMGTNCLVCVVPPRPHTHKHTSWMADGPRDWRRLGRLVTGRLCQGFHFQALPLAHCRCRRHRRLQRRHLCTCCYFRLIRVSFCSSSRGRRGMSKWRRSCSFYAPDLQELMCVCVCMHLWVCSRMKTSWFCHSDPRSLPSTACAA